MKKLLVLMVLLTVGGMVYAGQPGLIPPPLPEVALNESVVVDGLLGDWAGVNWLPIDMIYYNTPDDVTDAEYALQWSDSKNLVYMAVRYIDVDQVLLPHSGWNTQDMIEAYIDAGLTKEDPRNENSTFQFVMGNDGTGVTNDYVYSRGDSSVDNEEQYLAVTAPGADDGAIVRVGAYGELVYEMAMIPWLSEPAGTQVDLAANGVIGADVVIGTLGNGSFGNLCNNQVGSKWRDATAFQEHVLVPEPMSMLVLGLGGLAVMRRKK